MISISTPIPIATPIPIPMPKVARNRPAERWLQDTLDTVGRWFRKLSGKTLGQGTKKDPEGVRQENPGRKPWELWQV